jgi:hypothetical protein
MHEAARREGNCVIYAAALGEPGVAGYHAAVVVTCGPRHADTQRGEVFRDEALEGGKVWQSPDEALAHALDVGTAAAQTHDAFGSFSLTASPPNLG